MRIYSIRKRLNIPYYKITKILSETDKHIHRNAGVKSCNTTSTSFGFFCPAHCRIMYPPPQHCCKNFSYDFELQRDRIISKRKLQHQKHLDSYINPLTKASTFKKIMEVEELNQSQLAKKLGISRIRVHQILNILKLPPEKQEYILKHGKEEMITERQLRSLK